MHFFPKNSVIPICLAWIHITTSKGKICKSIPHFLRNVALKHPSIFYTCLIHWSGRRGARAYPSGHRARGGVHPGQVANPSQGHTETNNHARSHSLLRTIFLESPINLTCMFLDGKRKLEYPERTDAYTGRTCKLHTERSQVGIEPQQVIVIAVRRRC